MAFITRNVDFGPARKISPWRRVTLAIWRTACDPSIYGIVELDAEPALAYLERERARTGVRLTLTHFLGKAVAEMLERHPELNATMRLGRIYPRKGVSVTYTVASDTSGNDLGIHTVHGAHEKSVVDFGIEMAGAVREVRQKTDPKHQTFKKLLALFPNFLARRILYTASSILYDLNLWTPAFGLPRDPFGSVLITNIGSLGLDMAFGALVPATRIPLVISLGALAEVPMVRDRAVVVRKGIKLGFTIDHRVIDAVPAGRMSDTLKKIFANPDLEFSAKSSTTT